MGNSNEVGLKEVDKEGLKEVDKVGLKKEGIKCV